MQLSWSERRRLFIIGGATFVIVAIVAATLIATFYELPSCADGKQNADETGVDCGGSCERLCAVGRTTPQATFVRALEGPNGRIDVVAYIENRNQDAEAPDAPYRIELFSEDGAPLGTQEGIVDLPARSVVPVFIPGVGANALNARAFLAVGDNLVWRRPTPTPDSVGVRDVALTLGATPRVTAVAENSAFEPAYNRVFVATIFNREQTAVAASRTTVRSIDARSSAPIVFTWSEPLPTDATTVEVRVVPVLP